MLTTLYKFVDIDDEGIETALVNAEGILEKTLAQCKETECANSANTNAVEIISTVRKGIGTAFRSVSAIIYMLSDRNPLDLLSDAEEKLAGCIYYCDGFERPFNSDWAVDGIGGLIGPLCDASDYIEEAKDRIALLYGEKFTASRA